ncbi:MAG: acyl-ACP desaturase [Gemmataceae bacterium]|nr:acyl-ACP desaturase [Gemmataceae bacterium]
MSAPTYRSETPEVLTAIYRLFREYFDQAERKRRWSMKDDVPWDSVSSGLNPAISDVVETFCAVELFLPDYLAKTIPGVRAMRGRAWFFANWGYEESKHSMVLEDWLLRSKARTDEQMADLHKDVVAHEWQVPYDDNRIMVCYTLVQELATWLHYVQLRKIVEAEGGCPALQRILTLVSVDERAHYDFFRRMVGIYLDFDREGTIEALRQVVNSFAMPSIHLLTDSKARIAAVRDMFIFDDHIYMDHVVAPVLKHLGLTRQDLRRKVRREFTPNGVSS